ncbi:site-specific integrase [Moorellaceae bacterium AZ2]
MENINVAQDFPVNLVLQSAERDPHPLRRCRDILIVMLLSDAGLSSTEISKLEVDDVNLHDGFLVVKGTVNNRTVPLTPRLAKVLKEYITLTRRQEGLLITGGRKEVITPRAIHRIVSRLASRAGLDVSPRDLTELFYLTLARRGVEIETIFAFRGKRIKLKPVPPLERDVITSQLPHS